MTSQIHHLLQEFTAFNQSALFTTALHHKQQEAVTPSFHVKGLMVVVFCSDLHVK